MGKVKSALKSNRIHIRIKTSCVLEVISIFPCCVLSPMVATSGVVEPGLLGSTKCNASSLRHLWETKPYSIMRRVPAWPVPTCWPALKKFKKLMLSGVVVDL